HNVCSFQDTTNFKQTSIDFQLCVPNPKPDIEQIVRVKVDKEYIKTKIVKTPIGKSLEGQIVTGYKALIMADIILKITYVADKKTQSVHSFHTTLPFCEYVVLPEKFNTLGVVTPQIYIEDIYITQCDNRCLYGNITIMTVAEPCS
uniref:SPOCS domain-containing protein n=1 Tax=Paraclostridium bifermentans TaxID=1490 RepID=UPI00359C833E